MLSAVAPNGTDTIEAFEAAGGARALMLQLEPLLCLDAMTVTGKTVRDNLAGAEVFDEDVIRPLDRPFSDKPPIVVLHGSLAPESAIVKLGVRGPGRKTQFTGTAVVYENGLDAIEGIQKGDVRPGHVLVVRGMGPKGGPGMAGPASRVVFAIDSAGLSDEVAFVSDGQLSGLCLKGIMVAEVSPESAVGGPRRRARPRPRCPGKRGRGAAIAAWRAGAAEGEGLLVGVSAHGAADVHGRGAHKAGVVQAFRPAHPAPRQLVRARDRRIRRKGNRSQAL